LLLLKINVEKIDSDKVSCAKKTGKYARRKTVITKKLSNQVQDLKKIGIKLYSINWLVKTKKKQMQQNKFTFQSQNLIVDWISFKFQYLDNPTMMKIANYLLKIGFNSYQESGKLAKPVKKSILVSSKINFKFFLSTKRLIGG
jgi:hypothetical protein